MSQSRSRGWFVALTVAVVVSSPTSATGEEKPAQQNKSSQAAPAPRLVSLAPSNTELIYSLGASKFLIGVSDVCDFPPEAKSKPKAGSFVNARVETISMMKPNWILLVNGQENIESTLKNRKYQVLILKNEHLCDISNNLRELGKITGREDRASKLALTFEKALAQLKVIISKAKQRPRVFFCVWPEPLITAGAGSFLHETATTCGAINIAESMRAAYPRMNLEMIITGKPEILIMAHQAHDQDFWKKPPWTLTPASKAGKIFFLPEAEKDPLARPTLRIVDGLYWLSNLLHPELHPSLDAWKNETTSRLTRISNE